MAVSNAYTFRMPAGIPGAINRPDQATVEPIALDATLPFPRYGMFGKTSATGTFIPLASGDAATVITGLLVRPYPTQGGNTGVTGSLMVAIPPQAGGIGDRMKRGYLSVQQGWGAAPAKDSPVYVCITAGAGHAVGDIGSDASLGASAVVAAGAVFTGSSDTYNAGPGVIGQTEIAFNL